MWTTHKNAKSQRIQVLVDLICGTICAISALIGIIFFTKPEGAISSVYFTISLSFWIGYLALSLFMVGLGISKYYQEKSFNPDAIPKKKLKTPKVS